MDGEGEGEHKPVKQEGIVNAINIIVKDQMGAEVHFKVRGWCTGCGGEVQW